MSEPKSPRLVWFSALAWAVCWVMPGPGWAQSDHGKWEKLEGCRLIPALGNDGDSFHVVHRGQEYLFRLCYVDTPEGEHFANMGTRLDEQKEYFQVSREELFRLAQDAKKFSSSKLSGSFTVWTHWEDAKGASSIPRYFAVIETRSGDLAELLVSAGLARVYGYMPRHPKGPSGPSYMGELRDLERTAFRKKVGAWKLSTRRAPPSRP